MITLVIGIGVALAVVGGLLKGSDLAQFANAHALIVVGGGTVAVLLMGLPFRQIGQLMRAIGELFIGMRKNQETYDLLGKLSKEPSMQLPKQAHPLIHFAAEIWEQGLDNQIARNLLGQKYQELNHIAEQQVVALRNLAKYPPALGMTGTVLGLVSLFANLKSSNQGDIGPYLALAMTATFYGLILANLVILPLSDRLDVVRNEKTRLNETVLQVLLSIGDGIPGAIIEEGLREVAAAK